MDVHLTSPALRDVAEILEYIHLKNPAGARLVRESFERTLQQLSLFPESGRDTGRGDDTKRIVVVRMPFVMIYRIQRERVEVLRIRHTARNPEKITY